jgi:hypothetical protein
MKVACAKRRGLGGDEFLSPPKHRSGACRRGVLDRLVAFTGTLADRVGSEVLIAALVDDGSVGGGSCQARP